MAKKRPSPEDQDRRREARAAQQRAAAAAKRRRTLNQVGIVGGVAVVVIGIIATAVVLGTRGQAPSGAPAVDAEVTVAGAQVALGSTDTAIRVGPADAKVTIDMWEDYSCPICQRWEATNGDLVNGLVAKGNVSVSYHPIQVDTDYALGGGNASACVATNDPDRWPAFNAALFANHSTETDNWTAADFRDFAGQQGAGKASQDCIESGRYRSWITANTAASAEAGVTGTPTMFLNGQKTETLSGQGLVDRVNALAAA